METKIIPAQQGVKEACSLILGGELVVFPTETVYGLGANAFDVDAVRKIFEAKGRPSDNPLIVHISDIGQVEELACDIPDAFYKLAAQFMPGPLTIVLKKSRKVPYEVTAGGETVGIRMPANVWARQLIDGSKPLAAPSANRSKHISPTTAEHVFEDLQGRVPLILDDGPTTGGIESTVLDLTCDMPTILRPGLITAQMLAPILGEVGSSSQIVKVAKAPGMKYTHYAPVCQTVLAKSIANAAAAYDRRLAEGGAPVIVASDEATKQLAPRKCISLGDSPAQHAARIYAALHEAEKQADYIIIQCFEWEGIDASVMNRIDKAAGGKFV